MARFEQLAKHHRDIAPNELIEQLDHEATVRSITATVPPSGCWQEVAPGVLWGRVTADVAVGHVNLYAIIEDDGITLVDAGPLVSRNEIANLLKEGMPFGHRVKRLLVTHYHPDHFGLAGEIASGDVRLWTTRTTWLTACLLYLQNDRLPTPSLIETLRRAGLSGIGLAAYARNPVRSFRDRITPPPSTFVPIVNGQRLKIGTRVWRVRTYGGHAAEQATLWSNDGIMIGGDVVLPGVAGGLGVHWSEPRSTIVYEFFAAIRQIGELADSNTLCLSGHGIPFKGIPQRCKQLEGAMQNLLIRLIESVQQPRKLLDILSSLHGREIDMEEREQRVLEATALLNHLLEKELVQKRLMSDGTELWSSNAAVKQHTLSDAVFRDEEEFDPGSGVRCYE